MKVIKWADTGASLLDPVSAHLITPRYEDGLPGAAESPALRASDTRLAPTEVERRHILGQMARVPTARSYLAFMRGNAAFNAA